MNRISIGDKIVTSQMNGQSNVCIDPFGIICVNSCSCISAALSDNISIIQPKVAIAIIVDIIVAAV